MRTARFYQNLANGGNADAQREVGMWYISYSRYFANIDKDNQKTKDWLEKAASQGNWKAAFDLILLFTH